MPPFNERKTYFDKIIPRLAGLVAFSVSVYQGKPLVNSLCYATIRFYEKLINLIETMSTNSYRATGCLASFSSNIKKP